MRSAALDDELDAAWNSRPLTSVLRAVPQRSRVAVWPGNQFAKLLSLLRLNMLFSSCLARTFRGVILLNHMYSHE